MDFLSVAITSFNREEEDSSKESKAPEDREEEVQISEGLGSSRRGADHGMRNSRAWYSNDLENHVVIHCHSLFIIVLCFFSFFEMSLLGGTPTLRYRCT